MANFAIKVITNKYFIHDSYKSTAICLVSLAHTIHTLAFHLSALIFMVLILDSN